MDISDPQSKDGSPNPLANKLEVHQSLRHLQSQSFEGQEAFYLDPSNCHLTEALCLLHRSLC